MSHKQLKFDFKMFKVGDLVKVNRAKADPFKTWGVIVEIDNGKFMDTVKVHWLNYGTFWTVSDKLIKINKDDEI